MVNPSQPTKACIACGLQKPFAAFLEISGPRGTTYGNVCSTCRGSGMGKTIVLPPTEDAHGSSSTGLRIDSKSKLKADIENKQLAEEKSERNEEESKKRLTDTQDLEKRAEVIKTAEEKHREQFLDPQKQSFLNYQSKKPTTRITPPVAEPGLTERNTNLPPTPIEAEAEALQEAKAKSINLTDAYIDPSQAGLAKFHSAEFQKVKAWLGTGVAMSTHERQFLAKKTPTAPAEKLKADKDPLIDFVNETWEPSSPKPPTSRRR